MCLSVETLPSSCSVWSSTVSTGMQEQDGTGEPVMVGTLTPEQIQYWYDTLIVSNTHNTYHFDVTVVCY